MTKLYSLVLAIAFLCSCNSNSASVNSIAEDYEDIDLSEVSNEKKEIVSEIKNLQKNLEERNIEGIANHFDTPKRIEEIELSMNNSKIRNAVESNSSRLSIDVIRNHYDDLYDVMDIKLIDETLKSIPENQLLATDKANSKFQIEDCEFLSEVSINGKEVKFNIKSESEGENCKKDQQWKFNSNGEFLVLDRRYYL